MTPATVDAHHMPSQPPNGRPPHRPRHRVLALIVVVLLIALPGGYLVHSAFISRNSGKDLERRSSPTNLTYDWPTKANRRIYDVPIPAGSRRVAYYEHNSWQNSALYVQFRTSPKHLKEFLDDTGAGASALKGGKVAVSRKQAENVGWDLSREGRSYSGLRYRQHSPKPDLSVTVDTTYKSSPRVYVVSRAEF